jgi:hypothetical protein
MNMCVLAVPPDVLVVGPNIYGKGKGKIIPVQAVEALGVARG